MIIKCKLNLKKGKKGLGPNSWGNFRHLLPYHSIYHEPARFHDIGYELGLVPRKQIDDKFLQLMNKKERSWFAKFYYNVVRLGGAYFYNLKK